MRADLSSNPAVSSTCDARVHCYPSKRLLDLALTLIAAPIWVPTLLLLTVVVRLVLGKPVLFRQVRVGRHNGQFELMKFRTMTNERDPQGALLPDAQRMTRFGRFLRSSSLDELPELLNVLKGEMSLVGPRPLLVEYLPLYSPEHRLRHAVPPGLTGLAQVSGRNHLGWQERFDLDVSYARTNSLLGDLRILRTTVTTVLGRKGVAAEGEATMTWFTGYDAAETDAR